MHVFVKEMTNQYIYFYSQNSHLHTMAKFVPNPKSDSYSEVASYVRKVFTLHI